MTSQNFPALRAACFGLAIAGLISCGSDHSTSQQAPAKRTVQGAVVKGPVRQATITATPVDEGGDAVPVDPSSAPLPSLTDDNGLFSFNIEPFSDVLMLVKSSAGSYVDESDTVIGEGHPRQITLGESDFFEAVLPINATTVAITPYSMALLLRARREGHGANFSAFYQAVLDQATAAFGFDPSTVIPANPAHPDPTSDPKALQYALLLGGASNAINAMATELGIQPNYQLVRAFIDDLSDGKIDGKLDGAPLHITIGETPTQIPADVNLNNEILRFRNNNFSAYASVQAPQFDLSAPFTQPTGLKPFAKNDSIIVAQDATATTLVGGADSVLANDADIGGGHATLTATLVGTPQHGTATLGTDGKFTYIPAPPVRPATYYFGPDSFTYKATNASQVDSAPGIVAITITKVNHAPIADDIAQISVDENSGPTPGNVTFFDPDGDSPLTVSKAADPTHGTLTLSADGSFTYKPNAGYSGPDSFKFKVSDGTLTSAPATVGINVAHGTHKPVAFDDTFPANKGTLPTKISAPGVLANDSDADNDSLTVANAPNAPQPTAQGGSVTLRTDGSFDYTPPNANFTGNDTFTYKAFDGTLASDNTATVTLTVSNLPPVATDDSYSVAHDKVLTVTAASGVRANDTDGDPFTAMKLTDPTNGTVALANDGSFIYTPAAGFFGSDSFTYQDKDSTNQLSNTAKVTINVTDPNAPTVQVAQIQPSPLPNAREKNDYTVTLTGTDQDAGDVVKFVITTLPSSSQDRLYDGADSSAPQITSVPKTLSSNKVTFKPGRVPVGTPNNVLNDGFAVTATDGAKQSSPVAVNFAIKRNLNDPVACPQPTGATADCAARAAPTVQENSTDNSIPLFGHDADGDPITFIITALPAHGTLKDVSGGNTHSIISGDLPYTLTGGVRYTPTPDQKQADSFQFKVNDGVDDCAITDSNCPATVSIIVANNKPVAANDGPFNTNQNTPLTVNTACAPPQAALKGVLCNDTDNGDDIGSLQAVKVADPTHGTVALNADGSFTYTPAQDTPAGTTDTFTYQAKDSSNALSATAATVTININAAPVAKADSYFTNHGVTLSVLAPGVLANDVKANNADPAMQALLIGGTTLAHGTLAFNSDGSFTYTPSSASFVGSDSFQYRAIETGFPPSAPATVTISLGNHAPNAADQPSASTNEDTSLVVHLAGTDADNDPLTFSKMTLPTHGALGSITPVDSSHADVTYTPAANYNGPDSFTFKVNDGAADSSPATVSITVNPVNDPPVAVNDSYSTIHGVVLTVAAPGVLSNDTDPDAGDSKTAVNASVPSHGSVVLNANGGFTYTPNPGFAEGSDSFTYQAKDAANALSNAGTVNITITNATPVATGEFLGNLLQDSPTATIPAPGVLSNDKDADNTSPPLYAGLTAVLDAGAQHGTITLNGDGSWQYSPAQGYSGPDSFTYHVSDGVHSSNVVTASLFVDAIPVANNDTYSIASSASSLVISAAGVLTNDTDATAGTTGATLTAAKDTNPSCGSVTLNSDGSFTYTPSDGVCFSDSFTYHAVESIHGASSNSATVTINCSDCIGNKRLGIKKK